ncbi:hypothetical protein ACHWQZ_G004270 [Mnemiopsis leidyi]
MAMFSNSTTFPPSLSPYADHTDSVHDGSLSVLERSLLILYEVTCTLLTIVLNTYLIYTILFKLKISSNCVYIPMIAAAALGLFHGFGCNLIMTVSLIQRDWLGSKDWCGAAANIHKYIIYSIIYCQVVVSLEAAYLISHPHGYSRFSSKAKWSAILATSVAVFLNFPITICQFFFLKPSDILKNHNPEYDAKSVADIVSSKNFYSYEEHEVLCYRWFFPGTLDYRIIVYFIHTCNILAVVLVLFSYAVILRTVMIMREKQRRHPQINADHEAKRADRLRKQNRKIALMSLMTTTCVLAPWFLSLVLSLLMDIVGYRFPTKVLRSSMFLYYVVTWIFPVMAIMTNSALSRATRDVLVNITRIDLTIVANSMARFNTPYGNNHSEGQVDL